MSCNCFAINAQELRKKLGINAINQLLVIETIATEDGQCVAPVNYKVLNNNSQIVKIGVMLTNYCPFCGKRNKEDNPIKN